MLAGYRYVMTLTAQLGKTTWFDLPVLDVVDARLFYEGLFNWQFLVMDGSPVSDYWVIQAGDEMIGGIRQVKQLDPQASGAILYFTVDDLDRYSSRVKELGGKLVGPKVELGKNRGSYQWFRDRQGVLAGMWAPS
jgi:uncharacterized protein